MFFRKFRQEGWSKSLIAIFVIGLVSEAIAEGESPQGTTVTHAQPPGESPQESATLRRSMMPSPLPSDGMIEFPGNGTASVAFRATPGEPVARPALEEYASWRRAAEQGDAVDARKVAELMLYCGFARRLPISTEPPFAPWPTTHERTESATTEAGRIAAQFCGQRTVEEISSATQLLRLAAAAGDLQASIRLAELNPGSDESVQLLEAAWKRGSSVALRRLATTYEQRSIQSGPASEDGVKSLAARWLYVKLNESAFRQHSVPSEFVEALQAELTRKMEPATPNVRTAAIAAARQLLQESPQCCTIP